MENLKACLRDLTRATGEGALTSEFYDILTSIDVHVEECEEFEGDIIPHIYKLIEDGKIRKDVLFIALLVNRPVLDIFLGYESTIVKLDFKNWNSIFDFVYYKRKHWIIEVIRSIETYHGIFGDLTNLFWILKTVVVSNDDSVDIERLSACLDRNVSDLDPFFTTYIENLKLFVNVTKFIKENSNCYETDIFRSLNETNLLNCLSKSINLRNSSLWDAVSEILARHRRFNTEHFPGEISTYYAEEEIFLSFTILSSTINCIKCSRKITNNGALKDDEITSNLEKIQSKLIRLNNKSLQIDLLEDVFSLIFLRSNDLDGNRDDSFFCGEYEIRLILSLLKSIFEELKKQYRNREFAEFKRFVDLNKHISDGYWRLELLSSLRKCENEEVKNVLYYMLASPEALINMCLKRNNIEKAIQAIKIFGLEKSIVANEIGYSIAFDKLKISIISEDQKDWTNTTITSLLNNHKNSSSTIVDNLSTQSATALDLLATVPLKYSTAQELADLIDIEFDNTLLPSFFYKIKQMTTEDYHPIEELLLSCDSIDVCRFDEEFAQWEKLIEAYDRFRLGINSSEAGVLNFNHPLHKLLGEIQGNCLRFDYSVSDPYLNQSQNKAQSDLIPRDRVQYMQRVLKYLRAFSKILLLEQNNTDLISKGSEVSLFEVLKYKRIDLVSKLIYERKIDGVDFDYIFGKMKLDLTYHVGACSFPKVNLNRSNSNWALGKLFKPRKDVINYIQKRNWLLAFMINTIHGVKDEKIDSNEVRIKTLGNLMQLKDVQTLKALFGDSEVLTVLQRDFCSFSIDEETDSNSIKLRLPETTNWKHLYEMLSSISESKIDAKMQKMRDLILCNLIKSRRGVDHFRYIRFVVNPKLRLQIILEEMYFWPGDFCVEIINFETSIGEVDVGLLRQWLGKIQLYEQIREILDCRSWFEAHQSCETLKGDILKKIIDTQNIENLISFLDIHLIEEEFLLQIDSNFFVSAFDQNKSQFKIKTLLGKLPPDQFNSTCKELLKQLKSLDNLKFILDCLEQSSSDEVDLKNLKISLEMLAHFSPEDQRQFLCLMGDPLSILEVLLMNTRLEKIGQILHAIQRDLKDAEDEFIISVQSVDTLLRDYAEKSVDFKVVTLPSSGSTAESKIMQSIDSLLLEKKEFTMPERVPTKEEWIPDDTVTECMCCSQTTFSMFNRRHHCRRCGRVICWNCSLQKMLVESYGDILVRVCKDCFKQSRDDSDSDSLNSDRSRLEDFWILTDNPTHNAIVREEFAYENAPSVFLCLSILKYHSKSDLYPKFLLSQCENILQILHPIRSYLELEIDFNLIINMLKSLAIAAKMISNQCMLQWGASQADKMISQAEMLGLLAEKGYLHLLSSRSQNVHIDASILRHVRDKLLELEQWHLALEVSTKAGLDTAAVFAKWGKSFLRAGNLQMARVKFQMCFEKSHESLDYGSLHESLSNLRRSFHQSRSSLNTNLKPSKNPLLLNEIVQILESKTEKISLKVLKNLSETRTLYESTSSLQSNPNTASVRSEDSVSIINRLQSLNALANGNYKIENCDMDSQGPNLDNMFYEECVYYLDKYGSHLGLCQFYVRHNDFRLALEYMVENQVNSDIFIEIYLKCLKDGCIDQLQQNMLKLDPMLDLWKNYIKHICIYFEKHNMLHSLYQLQQFIGDFVRAAMTCIKFYLYEVSSFEEFDNRIEYLKSAQGHLKQELEQEQWVDVQSVSSLQSQEAFEEKSINNPALVMKLNSKEIAKHIKTIELQMDVVKFLTNCEKSCSTPPGDILPDIQFPTPNAPEDPLRLPTLFGDLNQKMQLAILSIVSGENLEDGFEIARKIIHNYKLKPVKIYCQIGRLLAKSKRHSDVSKLVKCIRSGGEKDGVVTEMCDEMLDLTARTLGDNNATDTQLEDIIKHISNRSVKINSYIETKQLRSAFLLAAKFSKIGDIRRILREAELYNRSDVKKLCQRYLQIHEHGGTQSRNN